MRTRVCVIAVAVVVALSARQARAQWPEIHPDLKNKKVQIRCALVMPAQMTFEKLGAKGGEGGTPEAQEIAKRLYAAVARELAVRGVKILPNPMESANDDAAKYAVADLQAKYDTAAVQLRKRPGGVEKGRYTLGDGVASFAPAADADTLVFIRGTDVKKTKSRKIVSVAMGAWLGVAGEFHVEMTFVDAKSGTVLALFRFMRLRDASQKTDQWFDTNVGESLHALPLPVRAGKRT